MLSIIAVDNDKAYLSTLKKEVEKIGFKCTVTLTPEFVLEAFKINSYDLVITDYKLARTTGLELINNLGRLSDNFKAIIITDDEDFFINDSFKYKTKVITIIQKPVKYFILKKILISL